MYICVYLFICHLSFTMMQISNAHEYNSLTRCSNRRSASSRSYEDLYYNVKYNRSWVKIRWSCVNRFIQDPSNPRILVFSVILSFLFFSCFVKLLEKVQKSFSTPERDVRYMYDNYIQYVVLTSITRRLEIGECRRLIRLRFKRYSSERKSTRSCYIYTTKRQT